MTFTAQFPAYWMLSVIGKLVQPSKAPLPISSIEFGVFISESEVQPLKRSEPIIFTPSFIMTVVSVVWFWNSGTEYP